LGRRTRRRAWTDCEARRAAEVSTVRLVEQALEAGFAVRIIRRVRWMARRIAARIGTSRQPLMAVEPRAGQE